MRAEDLIRDCERIEQRILTRCAGLLEISPLRWLDSDEVESKSKEDVIRSEQSTSRGQVRAALSQSHLILLERFAGRGISFLHRTATGFLIDTEPGQDILRYYSPLSRDRQTLWLRVELIDTDMLDSLTIFDREVADEQMARLVQRSSLEFVEKDGIGVMDLMHQEYQRLLSPNPPKAVIGYSNFIFSNLRMYDGWPRFHRDFVGFAASLGLIRYLCKVFSQGNEGLKPRVI